MNFVLLGGVTETIYNLVKKRALQQSRLDHFSSSEEKISSQFRNVPFIKKNHI